MRRVSILLAICLCLVLAWNPTKVIAGTITVNDLGHTVKIHSPAKRYVVLFPQALPFFYMLHAQKGLVGYPGFGVKKTPYFSGNLILLVDPNFKKRVEDVGYPKGANIEAIVGLKPDFVVDVVFAKALDEKIEKFGIPVIGVTFGFGNIKNFIASVKAIATATGHVKEGQKYIDYYKGIIELLQSKLKNAPTRPKVLYLSYEGPKSNKLTSGGKFDTLIHQIISTAGGIDVARNVPGFFGEISDEDILKWNPDYIIVGPGGNPQDIYNNPKLRYINAVIHKRVYKVPSDGNARYSNWYTPEKSSLGMLWTAKLLHPKLFKNISMRKEAAYYYREFWNINMKSISIKGSFPWRKSSR